ncbi:hypothetical protein A3J17_02745 [Candidatus Curtissbacteria bacterium RIFCSPLOWO2_02_FULL_40_11]|uniref:Glycosyl transferase family 1 n=2 Tax=Candidatus Curtissiibacteriota TaxID=1752717 RepID=A0A1F5GBT1_9BACT|nr:MAG: hypothetical protein A2775_01190 [Candidatus Curtissbacteria bacterium RIFCSPHIGHO2_01_FULL_39_57]OGD89321.1 MAG: hypothetical protein A3D04_00550 [Candidatus Curtissbacteria bacterium RIFCSPHIGHO2_02_FULL_40_16b]OGD91125.1 MAG: hypothetical protein A3E11_00830 [Candidatus Curtissbacteria bacterium RIFCSPHIGHO2_12_FULL_38_37]OGD99998.1 MAG: hypothetical protein A3J17_02745 [Candidatus Curtissbacteria bacterium RIFCSPLOWO2_02_FULL_40_11]OGE12701.1 MAG: hypothetical protein A3G14_00675 [C
MKIGIDARFAGPEGTGIGKYTEKLIEHLQKIDSINSYSIFLKESNWNFLKLNNKNFQKVLADVSWYSIEEQIKMPIIYNRQNLDLLHIPHFNVPLFYKGNFVVTIHDLIHREFTTSDVTTRYKLIFKLKKFGYQKVVNNAIKNSRKIITPSKFVKDQIIETFGIDPAKIVITYEAAEEEYFRSIRHPERSEGSQPLIIYVGNAYPHKNLENLLKAMKLVDQVTLLIVCPRDIFYKRIKLSIDSLGLNAKVKLLGYLRNDVLVKLFKKSTAYIFPSLSEGFGIPGLNAMASKLPVLASDIPILKEVYGKAALYFDPNDPRDIAEKVNKVLSSQKIKNNLVKEGKKQVKKYSWEKMAQETLKVYEESI